MNDCNLVRQYSDAVKFPQSKNLQNVFDRQNELCEFFIKLHSLDFTFNYRVTNDAITIHVFYDKPNKWDPHKAKVLLGKLVEKCKLHLIGYEIPKIYFHKFTRFWVKKRLVCEYIIHLNLMKFDLRIFHFSPDYLNYEKGFFSKFELF